MNFLQEAKEILEVIHSLKERRMNRKHFQPIERNDTRKWSIRESNISNSDHLQLIDQQRKGSTTQTEKQFRITYLRTVIPYLDIKTILNLSAINREFNQFIISIYFYKFINEMHQSQKPKRLLNQNSKDKSNNQHSSSSSTKKEEVKNIMTQQGGFFSKLTGAFSMLTGTTGTTETTAKKEIDSKEIMDKFALHEKVLNEKKKQFVLSKEIREIRDEINKYIDERYEMQMNKNANQNTINNKEGFITMTDKEIEMIKKEKLEKESEVLSKEVDKLKKKSELLKKELERLQEEDIDSEMLLNSLANYVKNNMNYDDIKEELAKIDLGPNIPSDNI